MKRLLIATALWLAASGVAGNAMGAEKAVEKKEPPTAAKTETKTETKAVSKEKEADAKRTVAPKAGALMVNINTATKDELKALKGIGDTRAQDIIDYRKKHGDFKSIDDLEKVKGIGPGTMKQLRSNLTVSGETVIPKKAESPAKAVKDEKAKETKAAAKAVEEKAKK